MNSQYIHAITFRLTWPLLQGFLVYILLLMVFDNVADLLGNFVNAEMYLCMILSFLLNEAIRLWIGLFNKFLPSRVDGSRFVVQTIGSIACVLLIIGGTLSAYFIYLVGYSWGGFDMELTAFISIFSVFTLLFNAIHLSIVLLTSQNTQKIKDEELLRQNLDFQVQTFKNNINPSLFYESMEQFLILLYRDYKLADKYIYHLSERYRYVLENKQEELKSLEEELPTLDSLSFLFNEQHHHAIEIDNQVTNVHPDQLVVTNTLATVIELLTRKTIISKERPLRIKCYIDESDNYLVFEANLNERFVANPEMEKRADMLVKAYEYFTSKPFMNIKAGELTFIKIPLLEVNEA